MVEKVKKIFKETSETALAWKHEITLLLIVITASAFEFSGLSELDLFDYRFYFFAFFASNLSLAFVTEPVPYGVITLTLASLNAFAKNYSSPQNSILLFAAHLLLAFLFYVIVSFTRKRKWNFAIDILIHMILLYVFTVSYHLAFDYLLERTRSIASVFHSSDILYASGLMSLASYFGASFLDIFFVRKRLFDFQTFRNAIYIPLVVFIVSVLLFLSFPAYSLYSSFVAVEGGIEEISFKSIETVQKIFNSSFNNEVGYIENSFKFLANLPGVQWQTPGLKKLANQRISEFFALNVERGLNSCCVISEDGRIVFYAGIRPEKKVINALRQVLLKIYPVNYEGREPDIFKTAPINDRIYFAMPLYRTSVDPSTGRKPDGKRNGFLLCEIDLSKLFSRVQSEIHHEDIIQVFCYRDGNDIKWFSKNLESKGFPVREREKIVDLSIDLAREYRKQKDLKAMLDENYVYSIQPVYNESIFSVAFENLGPLRGIVEKAGSSLIKHLNRLIVLGIFLTASLVVYFSFFSTSLFDELKKKQKELAAETERKLRLLETILRDVPAGFLLVRSDGEIVFANAYGKMFVERHTGVEPRNLNETPFAELLEAFFSERERSLKEVVVGKHIYGTVTKKIEINGKHHLAVVLNDITEMREMQQAAISESRTLILGELARNFSEITTEPLQVALSKIELALCKGGISEDLREILKGVKSEILKVIDASLGVVSLSVRTVQKQEDIVYLDHLLDKVLEVFKATLDRYDIRVKVEIETEKPAVKGLLGRIELALVSVLHLSIEALKSVEGKREIKVRIFHDKGELHAEIIHPGKIFTHEELQAAKREFFANQFKGNLLNLFLARQLAEKDGGELEFYFNNGETVYRFSYPEV